MQSERQLSQKQESDQAKAAEPDNWRQGTLPIVGTPAESFLSGRGCGLREANGYRARYHPGICLDGGQPRPAVIFPVRNNGATVAAVGFYLDDGYPLHAGGPVDPEMLRSALPAALVALWDAPASTADQAPDPDLETATVRSWPPEIADLVEWFCEQMDAGTLPDELTTPTGARVLNPAAWYVHLAVLVDQGPEGPHAHRLRSELEKLREMVAPTGGF
jgi:hypothetical protein